MAPPRYGSINRFVCMYSSWYADVPSGAVITIVGSTMFAIAYLASDVTKRRAVAKLDDHRAIA